MLKSQFFSCYTSIVCLPTGNSWFKGTFVTEENGLRMCGVMKPEILWKNAGLGYSSIIESDERLTLKDIMKENKSYLRGCIDWENNLEKFSMPRGQFFKEADLRQC